MATDEEKAIEEGNKASKRQEARTRLVGRQGEEVLQDPNLEKLIDEEVQRMEDLVTIAEPTAKNKDVDKRLANSPDNRVDTDDNIPGQTTKAQNTQNQDVTPAGSGPKSPETGNKTPNKKTNRQ